MAAALATGQAVLRRGSSAKPARKRFECRKTGLCLALASVLLPQPSLATMGHLDPSFGVDGVVTTSIAGGQAFATARAATLEADGRILVAARISDRSTSGAADIVLLRYLHDGSLDPGFGVGGIVTADLGTRFDDVADIKADAQGRIVILARTSDETTGKVVIRRYENDGSADSGFGVGGSAEIVCPTNFASASRILEQADHKLVAVGTCTPAIFVDGSAFANGLPSLLVARFEESGVSDTAFGTNGRVERNGRGSAGAELQSSGRVVVATERYPANAQILGFDTNGNPDPGFGSGGIVDLSETYVDGMRELPGDHFFCSDYEYDANGTAVGYLSDLGIPAPQASGALVGWSAYGYGLSRALPADWFYEEDPGFGHRTFDLVDGFEETTVRILIDADDDILLIGNAERTNETQQQRWLTIARVGGDASACPEAPVPGCNDGRGSLTIRRKSIGKQKIGWSWTAGSPVAVEDLGAPDGSTSYVACMYDVGMEGTRLFLETSVDAGPLWSNSGSTWQFSDKSGQQDGISTLQLTAGDRAKVRLEGKQGALSYSTLVSGHPLTQLRDPAGTLCLQSDLTVLKDSQSAKLSARTP